MPSMPKEYYRDYRKTRNMLREIVAWDGEGVTNTKNEHFYNMLANSRGEILEAESIGTQQAFDFFLAHRGNEHSLHIVFVGSYDVAMILKELSGMKEVVHYPPGVSRKGRTETVSGKTIIEYIYKNETSKGVKFQLGESIYEVSYRPRKVFKLARFREGSFYLRKGRSYVKNADRFVLWDVFGFSQSSFVSACKKYGVLDDVALEAMKAMKDERSTFTEADRQRVRDYCVSECVALSQLYKKQLICFRDADLMPDRHDGPGALAAKLLQKHGVKGHIQLEPLELRTPVASAYFGGRIELCKSGFTSSGIAAHDIASAYPAAATNLPSLYGAWENTRLVERYGCYKLQYRFPVGLPWYPLPYRDFRGSIRFSDEGEGWYWSEEVESAFRFAVQFGGDIEICEGWALRPESHERPFAFIPGVFDLRRRYKQEGNGAEGALKLAINSCYGQLARQVGGSLEKLPPFFSLVWAGMITSATRAKLVDLAMTDPDNIIAFATDGIYATRTLGHMDMQSSGILGTWECASYLEGVFVQAGVYWLRKAESAWEAKFRGFDRKGLETPEAIMGAWERGEEMVTIPTTRFMSYKAALVSAKSWRERAQWSTIDRKLNLTGGSHKRMGHTGRFTGLHTLRPRINDHYLATGHTSYPYEAITLPEDLHEGESPADTDVEDILDALDS